MKNLSEKIQEGFNEQRNVSDRKIKKVVKNAISELEYAPLEDSLNNINKEISFFINKGKIDYDIVSKNTMSSKEYIYSMDYVMPKYPETKKIMKKYGLDYNDEKERRKWEWGNFINNASSLISSVSKEIKMELKRRNDA